MGWLCLPGWLGREFPLWRSGDRQPSHPNFFSKFAEGQVKEEGHSYLYDFTIISLLVLRCITTSASAISSTSQSELFLFVFLPFYISGAISILCIFDWKTRLVILSLFKRRATSVCVSFGKRK